jgi:hypothetical protein
MFRVQLPSDHSITVLTDLSVSNLDARLDDMDKSADYTRLVPSASGSREPPGGSATMEKQAEAKQ